MSPADTARVLAKIQAYDRRTVGHADIAAWHEQLADVDLHDALAAVTAWYRDNREWVMPADIRKHAVASAAPYDRPVRLALVGTPALDPDRNRRGLDDCRAAVAARRSAP